MTDQQWWQAHGRLLEKVLDASRFPVAATIGEAAAMERDAAFDPEEAFEFGLERVLDGIGVLVEARSAAREG
jgi:Tetracyclin repressor-like, C-terminal domain